MDISLDFVFINTKLTEKEIVQTIFEAIRKIDEDVSIVVNPTIKPEASNMRMNN